MSSAFDRQQLQRIVTEAAQRLEGDWVLVGGAAAALWFSPRRTTQDVDLVPIADVPGRRYQLLDLASDLGLPIEALNSAADYFLKRLDGWQDDLVLLQDGPRARVFRPGPVLFLRLKARRLSSLDLQDCEDLLAALQGQPLDVGPVLATLAALPPTDDADLLFRRERLRRLLDR